MDLIPKITEAIHSINKSEYVKLIKTKNVF